MKLLANPIFVRMAAGLLISMAAFAAAIFLLRVLRRKLTGEDEVNDAAGPESGMYPYSAVIQQLKQQKFELQAEQSAQRRRTKTSEQITSAVIAHLPCGVVMIGPNGIVKQANPAARRILGFASPVGMGVSELFRDTNYVLESGESGRLADLLQQAKTAASRDVFDASYSTADASERALRVSLASLSAGPGEALGVAVFITDDTMGAEARREQSLQAEISAEMALELRSSLASIKESAAQMSANGDRQARLQMAEDISSQAQRLERLVGNFLVGEAHVKAQRAGV